MSEELDDFKAEIRRYIRANEDRHRDHEALMDALLQSQLRLEQSQLRMEEDARIFKRLMANFVKDTIEWQNIAEERFDGLEKPGA